MMIDKTILVLMLHVTYDLTKNLVAPLEDIFKNVISYNYIDRSNILGVKKMNTELIDLVKKEKPEYVFYHTYQDHIRLNTLDRIREMGSQILCWGSDDQWRQSFSLAFCPHIDYTLTTDNVTAIKCKELGYKAIKTQWAANPKYYMKLPFPKFTNISFVGQLHSNRREYLEYIKKNFSQTKVFGRQAGGYISFEDMIKVYNSSRINLHFARGSNNDVQQIKASAFAIPMCGAFLLTEYADGLEEYFELGKEIETFKSQQEAVTKIGFYLDNENDRQTIAEAGYQRALKDHTYQKRFTDIFKQIEGL